MQKIVIASNNAGKIKEFSQLFSTLPLQFISQKELNISSVAETGLTFVENAIIKARYACNATNLISIADDSGLEVDVLNGEPGIYSSRFAGDNSNDSDNNKKLIELLSHYPDKTCKARFFCALVLMLHENDPTPLICQGSWEGVISLTPMGENGFGYDPHFYIPSKNKTSAQLSSEIKNSISHRAQALQLLVKELPKKIPHL